MAEICSIDPADYRAHLEGLDEPELLAQQITQKGAIHAIEFLMANGCTRDVASDMLESLNANMRLINEVAKRKGNRCLFDDSPLR